MSVKRKSTSSLLVLLILLPFLLFALKKIWDLRGKATGTLADITIDMGSPQSTLNTSLWRNLSQGGEESVDMIAPAVKQLRLLQPEFIRIDHVFDYYPNLDQLDPMIKSILATGAKPLISLSYMEKPDSDWNIWQSKVTALVKRYSVDQKINGIYYEVWNEPDLFGGWHYNNDPNYLTLYAKTAQAVATGAPGSNYKLGGPATTAYYNNWIKALFKFTSDQHLRLDFVSWHKYSLNPTDYDREFDDLNSILSEYPQYFNIERLITEFGPNSEPSAWYDNQLGAIHLMSVSTHLTGKIHRLFTFEPIDGPTPRSSVSPGWGLLTHDLKPKPRFFALQFLNQLGGTQLPTNGDGSWVTSLATKINDKYQLLLVNYDPQNSHAETFPLNLINLPAGQYNFKTTQFLGTTSNRTVTTTSTRYSENIYLEPNSAILIEITPIR